MLIGRAKARPYNLIVNHLTLTTGTHPPVGLRLGVAYHVEP